MDESILQVEEDREELASFARTLIKKEDFELVCAEPDKKDRP